MTNTWDLRRNKKLTLNQRKRKWEISAVFKGGKNNFRDSISCSLRSSLVISLSSLFYQSRFSFAGYDFKVSCFVIDHHLLKHSNLWVAKLRLCVGNWRIWIFESTEFSRPDCACLQLCVFCCLVVARLSGKFIQVKLVYCLAETWKFKKIPVVTCVRKKVK